MNTLSKKILRLSCIVSIIMGGVAGGLMMYAAWDHNASEEIHSDAVIHWGYWLGIGISWFLAGSILFFILGLIPTGIVELRTRLRKRR